ncbi:NAD-dependent deacylase [Allohahella marinimesophila]|uniref:NAD-dependent protein deacylase n=1 Tax=Allohahella marinimesophila TaxID=1054972 RepID=A0ABP7PWY8_9GAMM
MLRGQIADAAKVKTGDIRKAAKMLAASRRALVMTGAGISAESGIPTFRDAQSGLWAKYRPEDLATPEAFQRNPGLVWRWYQQRRRDLRRVQPNAGHKALARLAERIGSYPLVTQNVDDLHERAGSERVIHLHGELFGTHCFECLAPCSEEADTAEEKDRATATGSEAMPPRCVHCGAFIRPSVVWFGEMLPAAAWAEAEAAAQRCDVLLCIGTSSLVYPAAHLPGIVLEAGGQVVQVNPEPTALDTRATINLRGKAGEILPALLDAVNEQNT